MLNKKLSSEALPLFFDNLSKQLISDKYPTYAMIRIVIPEIAGTQSVAHWLPLIGLTVDPNDRAVYIILNGLTHRTDRPDMTWASIASDGSVNSLLLLSADGSKTHIELSKQRFSHEPRLFKSDPARSAAGRVKRRTDDLSRSLTSRLAGMRAKVRGRGRAPLSLSGHDVTRNIGHVRQIVSPEWTA